MFRTLLILLLVLGGVGFAQEAEASDANATAPIMLTESGTATEVAPGITVIIDPVSRSKLALAEEIYHYPNQIDVALGFDKEFASFTLELASKVTTRVYLETSEPSELIMRSSEVVVPEGARISTNFVAFSPHVGVIWIYNEEGDLLAEVPYEVRKQSQFRQSISGSASASMSTDFSGADYSPASLALSYDVMERTTGVGAGISFEYTTDGVLKGRGSITGSYSW